MHFPSVFRSVSVVCVIALPAFAQDLTLPGTQPIDPNDMSFELLLPAATCSVCHGNFNQASEPYFKWRGSMMAQSARDPLLYAALAVANQDVPGSGEYCLRCHAPLGWLNGRSTPTDGSALDSNDQDGVQCIICHRMVDPLSPEGQALVEPDVPGRGNGMYVIDDNDIRRGPYNDSSATHATQFSQFHLEGNLCGTCHDVSNPLFATDNDTQAPHEYGAIERTFSEWELSSYSGMGTAGSCQSCHMPNFVGGRVCSFGPPRDVNATHDFMGANTWIPDVLPIFWSGFLDPDALAAGKARAQQHLQQAATMMLSTSPGMGDLLATVRVTNLTGHKLPTGYPEGRRIWLRMQAFDTQGNVIAESGAYDDLTGDLTVDPQAKVYEMIQGLSPAQALATGLPEGPSLHFILNDVTFKDNRIPPAGFENLTFAARGMSPVGAIYADGQNWDETTYHVPANTARITVDLLYQTSSKEYIEFLRDTNVTNTWGQDLYDAWTITGRSAPVTMATSTVDLPIQARAGNVNLGDGPRADVLFIDGQTGDGDRVTFRAPGQPFQITFGPVPAGPASARLAGYLWIGLPTDASARPQPLGLGTMVFPTPWTGGPPQPRKISNQLGHEAQLGTTNFNSSPAPSTWINAVNGLNHAGLNVTGQVFIQDRGSLTSRPISISNAVILRIQ